jgi:hypothetical protein
MSAARRILGESQYFEYRKIVYYETHVILENRKEFISSKDVSNFNKMTRLSDICDFLYLEKDMENFNKVNSLLKILQIKEKVFLN